MEHKLSVEFGSRRVGAAGVIALCYGPHWLLWCFLWDVTWCIVCLAVLFHPVVLWLVPVLCFAQAKLCLVLPLLRASGVFSKRCPYRQGVPTKGELESFGLVKGKIECFDRCGNESQTSFAAAVREAVEEAFRRPDSTVQADLDHFASTVDFPFGDSLALIQMDEGRGKAHDKIFFVANVEDEVELMTEESHVCAWVPLCDIYRTGEKSSLLYSIVWKNELRDIHLCWSSIVVGLTLYSMYPVLGKLIITSLSEYNGSLPWCRRDRSVVGSLTAGTKVPC